jgi:hypothetical protein
MPKINCGGLRVLTELQVTYRSLSRALSIHVKLAKQ